jgi:putative flippase GtrA
LGNRHWTFRDRGTLLGPSLKYAGAHALGYLLNLAILLVFVDWLNYSYRVTQICAMFAVAGFLFVTFKYFVFIPPTKMQERRQ